MDDQTKVVHALKTVFRLQEMDGRGASYSKITRPPPTAGPSPECLPHFTRA